ncbi:MAG: prepilin-type N-terminal cleavage/methylation domain-containing protein [Burkholderiales bacterium]
MSTRHPQRGLSMIELMIGVAIALFLVASGSTLFVGQLRENRALTLEARLMQDLRTTADVIARDLRRAGYWGAAGTGANPYAALEPVVGPSTTVDLRYSRDAVENNAVDSNEQFGFRLRNGAIELQLGAGNWQAMTDTTTFTVTEFNVTPEVQDLSLESICPHACAAGSTTCPPHQQVRSLRVAITATLLSDTRVVRSLHSNARVRSDAVVGTCS